MLDPSLNAAALDIGSAAELNDERPLGWQRRPGLMLGFIARIFLASRRDASPNEAV